MAWVLFMVVVDMASRAVGCGLFCELLIRLLAASVFLDTGWLARHLGSYWSAVTSSSPSPSPPLSLQNNKSKIKDPKTLPMFSFPLKKLPSLIAIPIHTPRLQSRVMSSSPSSRPAATIQSLDHLVLTVTSIPKTTAWYAQHLGMRAEAFVSSATPDVTRHSLVFGSQKINLHELGKV